MSILRKTDRATLVGSTEKWEIIEVLSPEEVLRSRSSNAARACSRMRFRRRSEGCRGGIGFRGGPICHHTSRPREEAARAHAAGDEVRTVIAGYHWFTDWGRDTMISLEGLTLVDRPVSGGGLHPAHFRALRPRRFDPEHVSRWRRRRACITPPTRRSGFSTRSVVISKRERRSHHAQTFAADLDRHRRASSARDEV